AVALDDADDEMHAVRPRGAREPIDCRAGDVDAALPVASKVFAPFVGARADDSAEVEAAGIRGDEGFGEKHEPRALLRRLPGQRVQLVDRPLAIERHGRRLHDRDLTRRWHRSVDYTYRRRT